MNLYLDDDSVAGLLIQALRQAGHDVLLPADLGIAGVADSVHLRHAIREQRTFLTHNYEDFDFLHELLRQAQGHHPGILVVRRENDAAKNMKAHHIVRAIGKLIAASVPIADQYIVLNHWR